MIEVFPQGTGSGSGTAPKVLQIVTVTPKTDTASGNGVAPTWNVAYSGSITTTSATSRVMVVCNANAGATNDYQAFLRLERAGTPLLVAATAGSRVPCQATIRQAPSDRMVIPVTLVASEAPGSIATFTYDLAFSVESPGNWFLNRSGGDTDAAYVGRAATTMFLIEYTV